MQEIQIDTGAKSQHTRAELSWFFGLMGKKPASFAALHLPIPVVTMLLGFPAAGITHHISSSPPQKAMKR